MSTASPRRDGSSLPPTPIAPAIAAAQYTRWGWPVTITGRHLLLTTGNPVSAVELPADLAEQVQHHLAVRMLAGPVVALPGTPCRRLLLAGCADQAAQAGIDRLEHHGAITHRCGALVPLPPSRLARGAVTWTVPPPPVQPWLPPFTAIAAAVRTLTHTAQPS
ncbi:MAG: hypothetical protein ACR2FQ_10470 [Pseudonocardiaceae bacterium]